MFLDKQRVADFCRFIGEIDRTGTDGVREYWHICRKHGNMTMIPYYGFSNAEPVLTCPMCLDEHLDSEGFVDSEEAEHFENLNGSCETCGSEEALTECKVCGNAHCFNHIKDGICFECNRGGIIVIEQCTVCAETNNVEGCEICGKSHCPRHMVEGTCEDCVNGINTYRKGWVG